MKPSYFYKQWGRLLGLLLLLLLGAAGRSQAQLYFGTSDGTATANAGDALNVIDFGLNNQQPVLTSVAAAPTLMALDLPGNRAFIYESSTTAGRGIKVFDLGGTLQRTLSVPAAVTAIEYDPLGGYVYFATTDGSSSTTAGTLDAVHRLKADGSGGLETLISAVSPAPAGLSLNLAANELYLADNVSNTGSIKVLSLSGSTATVVRSISANNNAFISALDYAPLLGYIYYLTSDGVVGTQSANDALNRVQPSGSNNAVLLASITVGPNYLALDVPNNRVFVYNAPAASRAILSVQLNGGNTATVTKTYSLSAQVTALETGRAPTVDTVSPATSITGTTATVSGTLVSDGGQALSSYGVVYIQGTSTPTLSNRTGQVVSGTSSPSSFPSTFPANLTGLTSNTQYTAVAYATNAAGTTYGDPVTFTTATLPTVTQLAPPSGPVGTSVVITGTGFALGATVTFNGTTATTVTVNSATQITATVPAGATTGNVVVTTSAGSSPAAAANVFTVTVPTTVTSIVPASTNPTNAASVQFTVTFAASVSGLTTNNFTPANGGSVAGSSVTSVSAGPGTTYTVTVNTGSGSGTLGLTLANSAGVSPSVSNLPFTGTPLYTIDKTAPTVSSSSRQSPAAATTNATSLTFRVTFSEAVSGVTTGSFTFTPTSGSTTGTIASVASVSGSNSTQFDVTVNSVSGNGTVRLDVKSSGSGITDAVGNALSGGYTSGETYTINQSVSVSSITQVTPSPAATATVTYRVTFSGTTSGLQPSNFGLTDVTNLASPSVTNVTSVGGSTSVYDVVVTTGALTNSANSGTLRLTVANNTGTTPAVSLSSVPTAPLYTIIRSFAAAPTLRIQAGGSASGNSDVTAFVDVVQVLQSGTSTAVANGLQNGSFESNNVDPSSFRKATDATPVVASPWSFTSTSGVARNGSAFGSTAYNGDAVALIQSAGDNNASISQNLAVPTGSYQINFQTAQRNYTSKDQRLNVFLVQGGNTVFIGSIQPNNNTPPTYDTFTSASFSVTAPALVATVSTTSASPTSTMPIPFSVSFTDGTNPQSVGTTFTASDVTVTNGTVTSGSFSGSGAGPYTFTVTPTGAGTVTVSLAANVANDANNTGNSASNSVSVQYQLQTATPSLTSPVGGSTTNGNPTFAGTSAPNAVITFYLNGQNVGTTSANGSGNFGVLVGSTLPSGAYTLYVTAQVTGQSVSNNSSTVNFTVDSTQPTPTVSTTSASPTSTAPIPFRVTFNEAVTGFSSAGITVTNGSVASFSGSGTTYNLTIAPNGTGTVTVSVAASSGAVDAVGNPNVASNSVSVQYNQPVTATPNLTAPANGSFVRTNQPQYRGTTVPGAFIFIYRGGALTDTTIANGLGNFHKVSDAALADGTYSVYVTATTSGSATSANSNTNTFTVDTTPPTVTLSSGTVTNGGATSTSPVLFTATFSEAVTNFTSSGIFVSGGTVTSGPTAGSGNTYTFQVTPSGAGTVVAQVLPGAAKDLAGNNNLSSTAYSFTFNVPTITVSPNTGTLPSGTQGVAYSITFSASGGSGSYTYAISGTPPSGLNFVGSTLSGTPTASGTYNFRITATDNSAAPGPYSGFRNYTITIAAPAVTSVVWNGSQSQDWFAAANWTPNTVPDVTIDATIPTAPTGNRFPLIGANAAQATARNVSIASGASLTMSANTLTIAANLTNNGTFNGYLGSGGGATGGTVVLGGSALSLLNGGGVTRFWNLSVGSNGAQNNNTNSTSVSRLLTLSGNLATSSNPFTLVSDATATAMVVNSGGVATGNVTVQRYIDPTLNPNLGYRHVSPAISNATVSSLATGSYSPVVNPAYNGSATPLATRPFPTVYGYDQSRLATTTNNLAAFDKGWFSPNATSDPLPVGLGRTVLVAANQTWNFTGTLNNGDQTLNLGRNSGATAANSGLHLVGNPYPSPFDWGQVAAGDRPNVDNVIYVWRSTNPGNPYAGAYGSYNNGTFTGSLTSTVLAQGQGFFVRVTLGQTAGTLTFRNSQRVSTYQSPTYGRTAETRPFVRLTLQGVGSADVDDAVVYFEQGATAGHDGEFDAEKLSNPSGLNVSTSVSADLRMAINGLNPLGTGQLVVPVAVGVPAVGSYTLKAAELLNLGSTPTYLRDRQTGAVIDLARQASYQFSVSDASALLTSRFELVFSPQGPLATSQAALAQQVALYPNPTTGSAFVELPAALGRTAVTATLVDAVGREVRTVSLPAQGAVAHSLDLRELPSGVYLLRLNTSAGTLVKKLTVE